MQILNALSLVEISLPRE